MADVESIRIGRLRLFFIVFAAIALLFAVVWHFNVFNADRFWDGKWYFWVIVMAMLSFCLIGLFSTFFWKNIKGRIDKTFLLPPSFFALLSGSLLGISITFFTTLLPPSQPVKNIAISILATILLLSSSASLGYISIALEDLRDKIRSLPEKTHHLRIHIETKRKSLCLILSLSVVLFILGISAQYFALR